MKEGKKDIKNLAKLAKNRLKNGFWEDYNSRIQSGVQTAKDEGKNTSNVIKYYKNLAVNKIKNDGKEQEEFYLRVKKILDEEGEVSNMIARLCDAEYLQSLNFGEKQRYLFEISARYCECKNRYDTEKNYGIAKKCDGLTEQLAN